MRVWIDQDLCTGDGLCLDHCPDVFVQLEDGIAYVAEAGQVLNDPGEITYVVPALDAGTYPFVCSIHSNMTGTLTVS